MHCVTYKRTLNHHSTAPRYPIKLLHHPKTVPTMLTNNMALLLHTPSSCCIITKQLHHRSQTPWHCSKTPQKVVASLPNSSTSAHKMLWHCSNYPKKQSQHRSQTPGHCFTSCCITPISSTSAHKHQGTAPTRPIKLFHQHSQTLWGCCG
jgi:hypothetical protein